MEFTTETVDLHHTGVAYCTGCFGCWVKTPGICSINDQGREVAKSIIKCDLLVVVSPVTFGGYSSEVKKVIDRIIPNISPFFMKINGEVHHKPRYNKYPSLVCVGLLSNHDPESEQIFRTLVGRNAINLQAPDHASGLVIENQKAEDIRREVKKLLAEVGVA